MKKKVELWLNPWEYNRAVLLNYLMAIVVKNGGTLIQKKGWNSFETEYVLHQAKLQFEDCRIKTHITSFVDYKLNDAIIYVELSDNIFFPNWLHKIKVGDSYTVEYSYFLSELNDAEWWTDKILTTCMTEDDFKQAAQKLFETINASACSELVTHRRRHYYDWRKYYYEDVPEKRKVEYEPIEYIPLMEMC